MTLPERVAAGDFAGWLSDAMAARRLSSRHVAMRTGLHYTTIIRLKYGRREPTLSTLIALLTLFAVEEVAA